MTEKLTDVAARVREVMETRRGLNLATEQMPSSAMPAKCIPDCPICGGLGLVRYDVSLDDARFGKLMPCPNAPLSSAVYAESGLTPHEREYSWDAIHGRDDAAAGAGANKSLHEAVAAVKHVLERRSGMVLLYGANGLAKSLMLKIAVAETLRAHKGMMARYATMADIMEDLRASYDEERPGASLRELTNKYARYPVLAIDELGVERDTDFSAEKQFVILDSRYNAAIENGEPLVTLLATNLSIDDFPPRIKDRLMDGRCHAIKLVGKSLRPGLHE